MDPLKPFKELRDRKLWPVAILLLAVLVAVPVLLSRDAEPAAGPQVADLGSTASDTEPVVDAADDAARDAIRKVIGREKDPFRYAVKPDVAKAKAKSKAKTKAKADTAKGGDEPGDTPASADGGGGAGTKGADPQPTATPAPTATATPTPAPERTFPINSLEVRFGTVEDPDHADRVISRLSGLPKGTTPALLYLGLMPDRKTAVFLVQSGVAVVGDGSCAPGRSTACETLRMRKGDIEFISVPGGGQYQVEILQIHNRRTTSATAARDARTHTFPGGKAWLKAMGGHSGTGLRYDAGAGTLKRK